MHYFSGNIPVEFKMVICPRCGIRQPIDKEFCETCGAFLLMDEEVGSHPVHEEIPLMCPRCQAPRHRGTYCNQCGSLLMRGIPSRATSLPSLDKKWVQTRIKEWQRLSEEKKKIETCLNHLETQKEKISGDLFQLMLHRYQDRLKDLSSLHQEVEEEVLSMKRKASEGIDLLEEELRPFQKRLEEFRFLYQEAGITKADFLTEKKKMKREIHSRTGELNKYHQILSLFPKELGGTRSSKGVKKVLFRPLSLLLGSGLLVLFVIGGYTLHQTFFQTDPVISKESVPALSTLSPTASPRTRPKDRETEKIKSLFDTVRQANLQQNIELFMTCFSRDFANKEKKRMDALKTWNHFKYLDLSFDVKKEVISGDTAEIQLEWLVKSYEKGGGKLQESRILLDTLLKKENGSWKILEIKPAS